MDGPSALDQPAEARPSPRVSVICNFHDAEAFFAEAIDSVLAQTMGDFELLLVDDGASDSSPRIAEGYADRDTRIRLLSQPGRQNRGRSAARNLGLHHAKGEFIAYIDADDRWSPDKLARQLRMFESHPDVDAVCGAVTYWSSWNGGSDRLVPTGHAADQIVAPPTALLRWYPLGSAHAPSISDLLMRAEAVRAVGAFEDSFPSAYDDQAFLAKFYLRSRIYVARATSSDYRLHERSCMAMVVSERRYGQFRRQFLDWFEDYLIERPTSPDPQIVAALHRALFPYRHPVIAWPLTMARKILRRLRAI